MNTTVIGNDIRQEDDKTVELIETILGWPEWKIRSICIDQSDIALLEKIRLISSTRVNSTRIINLHNQVRG